MPLFSRPSRLASIDDNILTPNHGLGLRQKPQDAVTERPQTAGGMLRRKGSRQLQSIPSQETLAPLITSHRAQSTLTLDTSTAMMSEPVGMAYGSPSDLIQYPPPLNPFPTPLGFFAISTSRQQSSPTRDISPQGISPQDVPPLQQDMSPSERPSLKRWRTMSGIFARRRIPSNQCTPVSNVEEDNMSPETPQELKTPHSGRSNSIFSFKGRLLSPMNTAPETLGRKGGRSPLHAPLPGDARAIEAGDDLRSPQIDVKIPDALFDRYSILFAPTLSSTTSSDPKPQEQKKQLEAPQMPFHSPPPPPTPVDSLVTDVDEETTILAEDDDCSIEPAEISPGHLPYLPPTSEDSKKFAHPPRSDSVCAHGTFFLDDVISSRYKRMSSSTITTPDSPSASLRSVEAYWDSRPCSPLSSSGSSTYSFCLSVGSSKRSKTAPTPLPPFSFPAVAHAPTDTVKSGTPVVQRSLSVPGVHSSTASWDYNAPSPSLGQAPSPSLKFGYDEPGSPFVCVAETVRVSVRSGQAQKPKYVVKERRALQKSCEANCVLAVEEA